MPLYPKNAATALEPSLFRAPTSEYRGAPFWSWNCKLDRRRLLEQIDHLKAMGLGGFHMHARVGLATEYLGEEFMGHVRACVEKARAEGMLAWLYDEDRWPSGFAGGLVTQDERHRAKQLVLTTKAEPDRGAEPFVAGPPKLLARYAVRVDAGRLAAYRRLKDGEAAAAGETEWRAFLRTAWLNPWFNNHTYVDTLSKPAVERFLQVTHEKYRGAVGKDFGGVVPAIFTDEPAFEPIRTLPNADSKDETILSWTDDFAASYRAQWGEDILDLVPELVWDLPGERLSRARWRYHDHNVERFAAAYADTIGAWCEQHNILFTGHMMEEASLWSQTRMIGEAMRSYRGFTLPGIDMLCDSIELNTAKQAQSAARQFGRPGVMSELYGVTGWDFDFTGHKRQGDWQAALGISVRVLHLSWVSMGGEAKRDYPAALDEHSPWYREYPLVENHFARLNTALTRGRPVCRVGVIHPIESYWLFWGSNDQHGVERDAREQAFGDLTRWLLHGLVDFDFVAESLLPGQCPKQEGAALTVGEMAYDAVVVPGLRTVRASTLERLEAMAAAGGRVIFAGEVPTLVDAQPSDRAQKLAARCQRVALARPAVMEALAPVREVEMRHGYGPQELLHQVREDGPVRWVFVCNTNRDQGVGFGLNLRGGWRLHEWNTITGASAPLSSWRRGDFTETWCNLPAAGHVLLRCERAAAGEAPKAAPEIQWREGARIGDPVPVTLSEPNVLLLDQAEWRLDDGGWEPRQEILRIGQECRSRLGLPPQGGGMAQPWVEPAEPPTHRVGLRLRLDCTVPVARPRLAIEGLDLATVRLNGRELPRQATGWWVDEAIQCLPLPDLTAGEHVLEIELRFGRATPFEWLYLLGDFGVDVRGRHARIVAAPRTLAFGDWTRQGLPFYAGNVTYHCTLQAPGGPLALRAPQFKAPLLTVDLDGKRVGPLAFPPYQLELGAVAKGDHKLDLTAFGSRVNAFTCLHHTNRGLRWVGPGAWRSAGDEWCDEWQLRECGILTAPRVLVVEQPKQDAGGHKPLHQ
jgi:hypothetical protein